jgi:hypothetical protein
VEIRIDFEALVKLQAQMRQAPHVVREELLKAMTEADAKIEAQVKELAPRGASGDLQRSVIGQEREVGPFGVEGLVTSPLNYVVPVELGTKPHFPPVEALIDWVKAKLGVTGDKEARSVAFLVARKISRRGTKGQAMFEKTLEHMTPEIHAIFGAAQDRIAERILRGDG